MSKVIVAFGVTKTVSGRTRKERYHTMAIHEDGTLHPNLDTSYNSWQDATREAKRLAKDETASQRSANIIDKSDEVYYWIADQYKAFQKRLADGE